MDGLTILFYKYIMDELIIELCNDENLKNIKKNIKKLSLNEVYKMIDIFKIHLEIINYLDNNNKNNQSLKNINNCIKYLHKIIIFLPK